MTPISTTQRSDKVINLLIDKVTYSQMRCILLFGLSLGSLYLLVFISNLQLIER